MTEAQSTWSPDPQGDVFEIPHPDLDDRLRHFRCWSRVDVRVFVTQRYVVFVDTTAVQSEASQIRAALATELASRQALVVNTRGEFKSVLGNAIFARFGEGDTAPIIAHELTREWMLDPSTAERLREEQARNPRWAGARLVAPTITYADKLVIDCGDLTLELLHTPGGMPDQTSVWVPQWRVLLPGAVADFPFPRPYSGEDFPDLRHSLARLQALDPVALLPDWGVSVAPDLLERSLATLGAFERRVQAAIDRNALSDPVSDPFRPDLDELVGYSFTEALADAGAPDLEDSCSSGYYHLDFSSLLETTAEWLLLRR